MRPPENQGHRGPIPMDPLGTGPLMPAVVVGWRIPDESDLDDVAAPRWVFDLLVQAGGYNMRYPRLLGAVLRLEANAGQALRSPRPLVQLFHDMAEDPRVERLPSAVRGLWDTWGKDYGRAELDVLSARLRRYFVLPPAVAGLEACVTLDPRAGFEDVVGWTKVEARGAVESIEDRSDTWFDGEPFTHQDAETLLRLADGVVEMPLSLFLVWENSD
ncbi:MAG: hypothetical protein AAF211_04175 [Myxococcota bacterium]